MSRKSRSILLMLPMLLLTMLLTGCPAAGVPETVVVSNACPAFPHPPAEVGKEINPRCFPVTEDAKERFNLCPAFKNWNARLMKYEQEIRAGNKL